ncbi:MAG TPA: hypothetical protein PK668_18310 [Myxococcota bacterium]|nr:hypothetical protein [Myxococcota bacterium]HRY95918.1 hypothetical protein [Myxococcota bacterium]
MAGQHAGLSPARWAEFSLGEQLLMIGNELHRASRALAQDGGERLRACYERALALTDLTVEVQPRPGLRRELLRWRDLLAALFLEPHPASPEPHRRVFRALLLLDPITYRQLPHVLGPRTP